MFSGSGVRRKFMGEFSFNQWYMVVICIWCALFVTSCSCFETNVLEKFVDMHILQHALPLFYKLPTLQVGISEENKLNATTKQFVSAKISGFALKQRSKTHPSLRQSNLQLQNEAARAVEHRKCAAGLSGAHAQPGLHD